MLGSTKLSHGKLLACQAQCSQHAAASAHKPSSKRYRRSVILHSSPTKEVALSKEEPASRSAAQKLSVNC